MESYCIKNHEMAMYKPKRSEYYETQKHIEYTDFIFFLSENGSDGWGNQLVIIESEEHDRFMNSNDEDDEMDLKMIDCDNFYEGFEKITGIEDENFENYFVSAKYIDGNSINLIVNVNGINKRYYIDVV